jgi:hypothetical protein
MSEGRDRDYLAEMDALIISATEGSDFVAGVVAAKLHAQLQEADPDLLDGWLHTVAVQTLRQHVGLISRQRRMHGRRHARARAFSETAREFADTSGGNEAAQAGQRFIGMFKSDFVIDDDGTRRYVPEMTGADHLFVAVHQYDREASHQKMLAAFHRAVAKRVGKKRTADVLNEEQYEAMYQSIVNKVA